MLAVARLPWLWQGGNQDEIAKELALLLAHTSDRGLSQEEIQEPSGGGVEAADAAWAGVAVL